MARIGVLRTVEGGRLGFHCPSCNEVHVIPVGAGEGPRWGWNGSYERPTFTPSIRVRGIVPLTDEQADRVMAGEPHEPVPFVCHTFVTDGQIQFLGDCTHALANQTVQLTAEPEA